MFYTKNSEKALSKELFKNPTSEYRGAPFWSWNCKLDEQQLRRQIGYFKEMGFGGYQMHARQGLATEYLGDEFMQMVSACLDEGKKQDMLTWLYDEDRWPSGFAGGLVTKEPKYAQRLLVFCPEELELPEFYPFEEAVANGKCYYIASYDVELNGDGELINYKLVDRDEKVKGHRWTVYSDIGSKGGSYNNYTYVDTLNKEAIDKFIEVTHERYKSVIGHEFGNSVPAIFTDEPQCTFQQRSLKFADSTDDCVMLPWTPKFPEIFKEKSGIDVLSGLPELLWNLPDGALSRFRYLFYDFVTELFAVAFFDNIGEWCEKNGIMLTGHLMLEDSLTVQFSALGEAMRLYRGFQLPGIDTLCDNDVLCFNAAKQCQSVVHQMGREGMLSELYGATNWDFDFQHHRLQGDWEAALGVTVRCPHLSWLSMAGDAKRDYPASFNYQAPWYKEYSYIENHFARLNTALTRGKADVKVAVIHPIESYWLHCGPNGNTVDVRERMDERFSELCQWLLFGTIDFDYVAESMLPDLYKSCGSGFAIGEMSYDAVIVPQLETIRSTTLQALKEFGSKGGKVIFIGNCPKYVDAVLSDKAEEVYHKAINVCYDKLEVLDALENVRDIEIRGSFGGRTNSLIYNMRQDEGCKWLFIAHGRKDFSTQSVYCHLMDNYINSPVPRKVMITVKGEFIPELYDTVTGDIVRIKHEYKNGNTIIHYIKYSDNSILLKLTYGNDGGYMPAGDERTGRRVYLTGKHKYELEEPNVLLLDIAEIAVDDGEFEQEEEILRAVRALRKKLGVDLKLGNVQPWVIEDADSGHTLTLRFTINSEMEYDGAYMAIEDAEMHEFMFNGEKLHPEIEGCFVDECIKTFKLPQIKKGKNTFVIKQRLTELSNTEYCYVLGDFGVKVEGAEKTIIPRAEEIGYSPLKMQTLPFYGGNIIYKNEIETPECDLVIRVPYYKGAFVKVYVDEKDCGNIVTAPYAVEVKGIKAGKHSIEVKLFGNRFNTFAGLHDTIPERKEKGPGMWYTSNDEFSYEYQLSDMGILAAPSVIIYE